MNWGRLRPPKGGAIARENLSPLGTVAQILHEGTCEITGMNFSKQLLTQATLLSMLASCTVTVPFTSELQQQYELGTPQISRLQFYLSDPVVLYRYAENGQAGANAGQLVIDYDRRLDEIILRPGTPGVVVGFKNGALLVSFEFGKGRFLIFGNQSESGVYRLMAEEWTEGHGKLSYSGDTYFAQPGSGKAHLEVQLRKLREQARTTRLVPGRRLEEL